MERNTIYNLDCIEWMKTAPKEIDLVLTSPPYNMTERKGGYGDKTKRYDVYEDWRTEEQYIDWMIEVFNGYDKILKLNGSVLFNFSYSIENPTMPYHLVSQICKRTDFCVADTIIWKKPTSIPYPASPNRCRRICEFVFVFCRKNEIDTFFMNKTFSVGENGQKYFDVVDNFIEATNNDGSNDLNKATFSTEFCRKLLMLYGKESFLVYDSFMGTGTTAESCIIEKMDYVGTELSEAQCKFAEKRLGIRISQPSLF